MQRTQQMTPAGGPQANSAEQRSDHRAFRSEP